MTLQQLRYVTAVAGTGTISHAVQQFYISQPSLTNAIRELEQEVGLALSKTASSVVSRTQCRHYVRLLFYELSACHSASEASNTATLYPAKRL